MNFMISYSYMQHNEDQVFTISDHISNTAAFIMMIPLFIMPLMQYKGMLEVRKNFREYKRITIEKIENTDESYQTSLEEDKS
jgi:hypothetical protein